MLMVYKAFHTLTKLVINLKSLKAVRNFKKIIILRAAPYTSHCRYLKKVMNLWEKD